MDNYSAVLRVAVPKLSYLIGVTTVIGLLADVLALWDRFGGYLAAGGMGAGLMLIVSAVSGHFEEKAAKEERRKAEEERARLERENKAKEVGLELMHRACEAARTASLDETFDKTKLRDVLHALLDNGQLVSYLRLLLGDDVSFSVTVKKVRGDNLCSVFRDSKQDSKSRAESDTEPLERHYFHERFERDAHKEQRCLIVHDTSDGALPASLKVRASERGYGTCVAIPLNLPVGPGLKGKFFANVGFLSLDSPTRNGLQGLFAHVGGPHPATNEGANQLPKPAMHLLFGLADTIATIIELAERERTERKTQRDTENVQSTITPTSHRGSASGTDA